MDGDFTILSIRFACVAEPTKREWSNEKFLFSNGIFLISLAASLERQSALPL